MSSASGCSRNMAANAVSNSLVLRTATEIRLIPSFGIVACDSSRITTFDALSGFQRNAARETDGITSFRSSSRFGLRSGPRIVLPVILPPGRAKLAINPARTGSPIEIMTIGIVVVAICAARAAVEPNSTMTSTGMPASSLAACTSRAGSPCAARYSMTIF
jgi:antitoxin (DNA-binding transcriptional repressor) of toxin-antitoxin stability system